MAKCSNLTYGLNPTEQTLYRCGQNTCEDGRFCLSCIDACHGGHPVALKGRAEIGVCDCQIHGVCRLFRGSIADLPALKCDNCRLTIHLTIHVHRGPSMVRYLCDNCGRKQAATAQLPEAVYLVPYISSMTWSKLRMRQDRAKSMANLYKYHVIPENHRWNKTHWGYRCELCAWLITGIRYQCMECPSWGSFCRDCWTDHDSNHALFIVNRPINNLAIEPLAMLRVTMVDKTHYEINALEGISIQSADTVTVQSMSLIEVLMVYQALVLGIDQLDQTPACWPHIANAIANIYESMAEYFSKRDQPATRGVSFIDYAQRHFDGHITADLYQPESLSFHSSKRLSLTATLLSKMFTASLQTQTLDKACFYINLGNRTVFILRTIIEPTEFYRIELADVDGKPFRTPRVRMAFMQAIGKEVRSFSGAFGHQIINSIDAIEE
ncbi:hypothetical protein BATDEDRAFT_28835 [Batrachochytrium dendrobatidis JAM81]|uniref:Uncharacterized protein n=2 Tax=Batrachochytrium dendrobatidis TaxID=109871 RepID=F4PFB2_BATDJ|nr:uncharacterized protein BATDEDRAFT_28835 [Batrachochytrium dendrobatidis JAM81]EGF76080.1 hypothetical protein BATDEDRAFT_28835 [Batrachochytrium dendrobatidis JAM81]|eukprot:XP_006683297.1 hypothetical protein BATDEDRAFT_28835 [Batrachochytrium dendrobatidis JAM81]